MSFKTGGKLLLEAAFARSEWRKKRSKSTLLQINVNIISVCEMAARQDQFLTASQFAFHHLPQERLTDLLSSCNSRRLQVLSLRCRGVLTARACVFPHLYVVHVTSPERNVIVPVQGVMLQEMYGKMNSSHENSQVFPVLGLICVGNTGL